MEKLTLPPELLSLQISPNHPHDAYFQTIFSLVPLAREQLNFALPPALLPHLDLDTLELANRAYIDEVFGKHFSDLVYTCRLKHGGDACICLLHEHKSDKPRIPVLAQIHRYQSNVLDYAARQESISLLVVPIVLYHGTFSWEKETFESLYPSVPEDFKPYASVPDYVYINLQAMTDEQIRGIKGRFLKNVYLAFKHSREDNYLRHHFAEIVTFAKQLEGDDFIRMLFRWTLQYLHTVSKIETKEFTNMVDVLSSDLKKEALTTYEQFVLKGRIEGMAQGISQGMAQGISQGIALIFEVPTKKAVEVFAFVQQNPTVKNLQVAEDFDVPLEFVKKIRQAIEQLGTMSSN